MGEFGAVRCALQGRTVQRELLQYLYYWFDSSVALAVFKQFDGVETAETIATSSNYLFDHYEEERRG